MSLVFFGAFVVINLVVGVIVSAYDQEKERQEVLSRQLKSVKSVTSVIRSAVKKSTKFTSDAVKKSAKSLKKGSRAVNQSMLQLANIRNPSAPPSPKEDARCHPDEDIEEFEDLAAQCSEATEQSDCRLSPTERGRERASSLFSLEMACFRIAESNRFENVVMALIVLNTVVLACECTSPPPLFLFSSIPSIIYDDCVG